MAGLADAGRDDDDSQADRYDLVSDAGAQISLENLFAECADQPEAERPEFVERTVRGFFPSEVPTSWDAARENVVATVRDRLFVELHAIRADTPLDVLQRPLSDDLVELVVYDGPDSTQYLDQEHVDAWGKPPEEVFPPGRQQLAARTRGDWPPPPCASKPRPRTPTSRRKPWTRSSSEKGPTR